MKQRTKTERVIFHHSLSNPLTTIEDIREWHEERGFEDIGYHFVILPSGAVKPGRAQAMIGAHALGRNADSVGVCLIGDFRDYEPTIEQVQSAALLYAQLCLDYKKRLLVEFHRPHIFNLFEPGAYNHFDACPGRQLDRADFRECLERQGRYDGTV